MSKVLVIPDIHLKPWIFDQAENILKKMKGLYGNKAKAVCLMDIADDFNQEYNMPLYEQTYLRATQFAKAFPDTLWCWGNHDISYLWGKQETGYSYTYQYLIRKEVERFSSLPEVKPAFIHRIDNVLFMHGALTRIFVEKSFGSAKDIDEVIDLVNQSDEDLLWTNVSPLWARPKYNHVELYPEGMMQVVGHTPMREITWDGERRLLSCDVFSTNVDRSKYGEERFAIVDTVESIWWYADEDTALQEKGGR